MSSRHALPDINVRDYLTSKGLQLKNVGDNEVHLACMFCGEDPSKRGRLYVNVNEASDAKGCYYCHKCTESGNLRTLMRHFGDDPGTTDVKTPKTKQILEAACEYYQASHTERSLAYLQSDKRGLNRETIRDFRIGFAPQSRDSLYQFLDRAGFEWDDIKATGLVVERSGVRQDFFSRQIIIPYLASGQVLQLRGKDPAGKYLTPPGNKARLFNGTAALKARQVVVCEGEFDAMALTQLGYTAVALPGAASMQEAWGDYLRGCQVIYAMFDPDAAGAKGRDKFLSVLDDDTRQKVHVIELPVPDGTDPGDIDPTSLIAAGGWGSAEFDELFTDALNANTLLVSVREALEEWQAVQGVSGLKLGLGAFDLAIRPGLLPGQVMIPLAKTNSGKTVTLLNIFQRASMVEGQEDIKILFLSLEQTRGDWFERARRIWNFYNLDCEEAKVNEETVNYWADRLMLVDKNRVSEEAFLKAVDDYRRLMGCKPDLVAVDYLGYWAQSFTNSSRYERVSDAVMSLKACAKEAGLAIIAPHQVSRGAEFGTQFSIDQARDSGAVEETADFAMSLWAEDAMRGGDHRTGKLGLELGKSRHGGKGQQFPLQFGYLSLVVVPQEDTYHARMAAMEAPWSEANTLSWQDAIRAHATGLPPKGFARNDAFGGP